MSNAKQNQAFSRELKAARQGSGYTVQDLADELGETDTPVDVATLTAWENGKEAPREWDRPTIEAVERSLGADGTLTEAIGWGPA